MIKRVFLDTATVVREALDQATITDHWNDDSALAGYQVSGLAGHTARAILTPLTYLNLPAPSDKPVGPAEYFTLGLGDLDPIASPEHAAARRRGAETAAGGPSDLAGQVVTALIELHALFEVTPPDRLVTVFSERCMTIDDYLITRIVEMVIHLDDLACSVPDPLPAPPGEAVDITLATAVEIAAIRHGHTALLRALTRRERIDEYPHAF